MSDPKDDEAARRASFVASLDEAVEEGRRDGMASGAEVNAEAKALAAAAREAAYERFARVRGMADAGMTTHEIMALLRGGDLDNPLAVTGLGRATVLVAGSAPLLRLWKAGRLTKLLDWAALVVIVDEAFAELPDDVRSVLGAQGDRLVLPETYVGRTARRAREERQEGVPDRLGDLATAEFLSRGVGGLVREHGKLVLLLDEGDGYEIIRKPEEVVVVSVRALLR